MLNFLLKIRSMQLLSWNDYYTSISISKSYEKEEFTSTQKLEPNTGNTYVYNCYFYDMSSSLDGGAIVYSLDKTYLLIEKCSFFNCRTDTHTAVIRVTNGNCIIALTCGYKGFSPNNDGFSSISISSNSINSVFDSSVSHCQAQKRYIMYHHFGFINIKSVNLSHNTAYECSTIGFEPNQNDEETKNSAVLSFSSFVNNTANYRCLYLGRDQDITINMKHEFKQSNVIENKGIDIIYSNGDTKIYQCSILNNDNPYFTHTDDSQIILMNSTTDNAQDSGNIIKTETTNSFILALTFIETGDCHNLFIHFCPSIKCRTPERNFFVHKTLFKCLFIFVLSK